MDGSKRKDEAVTVIALRDAWRRWPKRGKSIPSRWVDDTILDQPSSRHHAVVVQICCDPRLVQKMAGKINRLLPGTPALTWLQVL